MRSRVTPEQVRDVATRYLQPRERTVGWYHAGKAPQVAAIEASPAEAPVPLATQAPKPGDVKSTPPPPPVLLRLHNGVPAIVQRIALSPACYVRVLVPSGTVEIAGGASTDTFTWDTTSIGVRSTSADFAEAVSTAGSAVAGAKAGVATPAAKETNPEARLELALHELLGVQAPKQAPEIGPSLVVAVGDLDIGKTLNLLEASVGQMKVPKPTKPPKLKLRKDTLRVRMDHPIAQAQLGYVVMAPEPSARDALAWRLLLYVLTHGYEGRLGMEAISKRGLLYYIDGQYRSDGENAFVSLTMGVDPAKLAPMEALLREQLTLLHTNPPSDADSRKRRRTCSDACAVRPRATRRSRRSWRCSGCGTAVCSSRTRSKRRSPPSRRAISPKWRPRSPRGLSPPSPTDRRAPLIPAEASGRRTVSDFSRLSIRVITRPAGPVTA